MNDSKLAKFTKPEENIFSENNIYKRVYIFSDGRKLIFKVDVIIAEKLKEAENPDLASDKIIEKQEKNKNNDKKEIIYNWEPNPGFYLSK